MSVEKTSPPSGCLLLHGRPVPVPADLPVEGASLTPVLSPGEVRLLQAIVSLDEPPESPQFHLQCCDSCSTDDRLPPCSCGMAYELTEDMKHLVVLCVGQCKTGGCAPK